MAEEEEWGRDERLSRGGRKWGRKEGVEDE